MSYTPLGPDWWQANDGRWYPPPHPAVRPLQWPTAGQPAGTPSGSRAGGPSGNPRKAGKGIPTALIVVVVLLVVVGGGVVLVGNMLLGRASEALAGSAGCDFISDTNASTILGGQFEFAQLGGISDMVKVAADVRPLPDGRTCLGSGRDAGGERVVSVTRLEPADAQARFDQARTLANGSTEDRGGGISVATPGFFGKDVPIGDQAFCTTADLTSSSGVFVRRGNVLLYVSMTAAGMAEGSAPPASQTNPVKFESDDANCDLAQKLIAEIK